MSADLLSMWIGSVTANHPDLVEVLRPKVQSVSHSKGDVLYYSGEVSGSYYLTQGSVSLKEPRVSKHKKKLGVANYRSVILPKLQQSPLTSLSTQLESRIDSLEILTAPDEEVLIELVPVSTVLPGQWFGNSAFKADVHQSETAVCREHSQLLFLSVEDTSEALAKLEYRKLHRICKFLQDLPAFAGWSWHELFSLATGFIEAKYRQGDVIFRVGEKPEVVFIIISGEFEFTKHLPLKKKRTNSLGVKQETVYKDKQVNIRQLFTYTGSTVFGEYDIIAKSATRLCTCRCLKAATVLKVKIRDFRVKMWSGLSIPYFIEKHRIEAAVFAEFVACYHTSEDYRTAPLEPVLTASEDEELTSLKQKLIALTKPKWSVEDSKQSLQVYLESSRRPKRTYTSFATRRFKSSLNPVKKQSEKSECLRVLMSRRAKPPVNFFATADEALKYKTSLSLDSRRQRRRMVSTPDDCFVIVRR
jgi:CRP-like cAMP-binding protein